jgi:hypothetical protein
MTRIARLTLWILSVGCGKGDTSSGSAGDPPPVAGRPSAAQPSGDCKSIAICEAFPSAHVDSLCGTKSAKTTVLHVDSSYITDGCTYSTPNGGTAFQISRICMTKDGGGTETATQMFQAGRDDVKKNADVNEMSGIGDEAYYTKNRNSQHYGALSIRKGNVLVSIAHSQLTADTEVAMKTNCLIALYNELTAK